MNIVVCVKQVVDTEAVIALDGAGEVELTGQTMVIDPYSEFAVERAVQLKEELGGTVTLLTLGSQDCLAAVRHGLAMGADAAVLIEDDQWTARDAAQAAALLAEAASTMGADLIMGGWKSGDTEAAQVMGRMAAIMGLPLANMATGLSVEGDAIVTECEVDDGVETARLPLPAVVAAQQGLAEPRYPSVRDVMQARRRGAEVRPVADLAAAAEPTTVTVVSRELNPMIQEYLDVFGDNVITHNRLEGVGPMNYEDCINYAVTGPAGRASGWKNDTRKRHPYDMYDKVEWKEITLTGCDSMDRYYVHIQELYQSLDIIEQLIDNIPEGEYYIKQKPIIKVPEGQWYFSVEGASGEFGVYLDSKGDKSPYRMKMRPMGLSLTGALDPMLRGQKIADLITTGAAIDFVIPDIDR